MRVAEVAGHICVLEGLQGGERRVCIEVGYRARKAGGVNASLGEQVVSSKHFQYCQPAASENTAYARSLSVDVPG